MTETALHTDTPNGMSTLHACAGQELIDRLQYERHHIQRRSRYNELYLISRLDAEGEFAERGVVAKAAVADILQIKPAEAYKVTRLARNVFPTVTLTGETLAPKLPCTAAALADYTIDPAHGLVIDIVLNSRAAGRLDPSAWSSVEQTFSEWAHTLSPHQLAVEAHWLISHLDQDGPEPGEDGCDELLNELWLTPNPDGGGWIRGTLDAGSFEEIKRAVLATLLPEEDERKTLPERQADALAEICSHSLDEGRLPAEGGVRPHVTVIMTEHDLQQKARGAQLEFGGKAPASYLRAMLCDCGITPVVLGGKSLPIDVGYESRTAPTGLRKALSVRDRGCAHPGCARPPHWCQVHHVIEWSAGGPTDLDNCMLLCKQHHRMIHTSGWTVTIRDGWPEFIPPKWLDPTQTARRRPTYR
ncbi:HNH endonuclease signature motif containing protein [Pseudonocardia spinosispora]|uniref:HNH endonuclease signature motif containing protein n=1 Tax=Pseudonocardia spinosispora TaxID=103441 RepID=UPI00042706B7|nr:HNH endonuclease signature motif containing protein [Pseudonocardia spinosispora]